MPPAYMGYAKLPARDIDLIRRWIAQGAKWQKHWSFIPPEVAPQPQVMHKDWPRNAIDYYVLARLEHEGLAPSPEADRATLIRRVTLDLTGCRPRRPKSTPSWTITRPTPTRRWWIACSRSPRYGERMALQLARRRALRRHQRLSERRRAQHVALARLGDRRLQPQHALRPVHHRAAGRRPAARMPRRDQMIATGFNRNHRTNAEGGIIAEEFRVEYVVDRVDTTSTVWLGPDGRLRPLPRSQVRPDSRRRSITGSSPTSTTCPRRASFTTSATRSPTSKRPRRTRKRSSRISTRNSPRSRRRYASLQPEIAKSQRTWERWVKSSHIPDWNVSDGRIVHFPLDGDLRETTGVYDRRNSFNHQPPGGASVAKPMIPCDRW